MKPDTDPSHIRCKDLNGIFPAIHSKWAMPVVEQLLDGPQRFSALKRALADVTQKSLTAALRDLERDGLVTRIVTPTIPPRVDYQLTHVGQSLIEPNIAMARWAFTHRQEIEAARQRFALRE